jgi:hypothetical protein
VEEKGAREGAEKVSGSFHGLFQALFRLFLGFFHDPIMAFSMAISGQFQVIFRPL